MSPTTLGFRRLTDTILVPIKPAINGAIRRGVLGYDKNEPWQKSEVVTSASNVTRRNR